MSRRSWALLGIWVVLVVALAPSVFAPQIQAYRCSSTFICKLMSQEIPISQLCQGLNPVEVAIVADLDLPKMRKDGTWDRWSVECMSIRDR